MEFLAVLFALLVPVPVCIAILWALRKIQLISRNVEKIVEILERDAKEDTE